MTTFDERENAFEAEYAHEEELAFRLNAQALRSLARWCAGELGLSDSIAHEYEENTVALVLEPASVERVVNRLLSDLSAAGIEMTEGRLHLKYERFLKEAREAATVSTAAA